MRLVITEFAEKDLVEIESFLKIYSPNRAEELFDKIFDKFELITNFPQIGQEEFTIKSKSVTLRYVIEKQYKIIYSIEPQNIVIHRVFDTRQNPKKLKIKK
ncbi:MAG: type II toxin-antitoxin system RelE/ParE family toxin [Spirosomataceae bacterium]